MFTIGTPVYVSIPVAGQSVAVPGICNSDEFEGTRLNRNGATVPVTLVEVITFHQVPAEQSRNGLAKSYYKVQRQSAFFMDVRTEPVPELDDLDGPQLVQKLRESRDALQRAAGGNLRALNAAPTKLTAPVVLDAPMAVVAPVAASPQNGASA